jgi:hypothetical protein
MKNEKCDVRKSEFCVDLICVKKRKKERKKNKLMKKWEINK